LFHLLIWNFRVRFYNYEGIVPYRSSAQMSCRLVTQATNFMGDLIYIRLSTLRSHPVSIILMLLRAKQNASTSNYRTVVDLSALNALVDGEPLNSHLETTSF
jgi:hypothetical protein